MKTDDTPLILFFHEIGIHQVPLVGGKNASLGELFNALSQKGVGVPDGFALTAEAYRLFCRLNGLSTPLQELIAELDTSGFSNLASIGEKARSMILAAPLPEAIGKAIEQAYASLSSSAGAGEADVAVRSSATAEDLPTASFAGRMESFLSIHGVPQLMDAIHRCYASLFTDRAIKYRVDMGFTGMDIAISVGVQHMVRSDLASSGVAFTIDPDSGQENVIIINSAWGLGENIVQGRVTPDEWMVFKPTLTDSTFNPVIRARRGRKEYTMVYAGQQAGVAADQTIVNLDTPAERQALFSLDHADVVQLAQWCQIIEAHYGRAMDIEWAKDGLNGRLYIVQARPETVQDKREKLRKKIFTLTSKGSALCRGIALGDAIASGRARVLNHPSEGDQLQPGEILVTDITNPDWDTILKKAAAIVTNKGGRTSHAAIVARELGTVAVVGCGDATSTIRDGQEITVCCAEGKTGVIYDGLLEWKTEIRDFSALEMPETAPMFILADPSRAFELSHLPVRGVGLLRLEFAIANSIRVHPLALLHPERVEDPVARKEIAQITSGYAEPAHYFVEKLAEAVTSVAAAFYPRDVIVRMSDFKSNEYANLIGGSAFEPHEENPMIGLRGASRYYSEFYRRGFALECQAMKKVRSEFGMSNVKLMIPFCRTPEEGRRVLQEMSNNGLQRGVDGLEVYVMVEIPSNVLLADEFAELFDGFSIGSNDLTQLALGLDRDSSLISYLFDEQNDAVKKLIRETIRVAKKKGIKVGLCGQAPSDLPEFAAFLVEEGIDSISFNADALVAGIENILAAELRKKIAHA